MGCICCCEEQDDVVFPHQRTTAAGRRGYAQVPAYAAARANNACRVCGAVVDPALIDSHEESCRAQARRAMNQAAQTASQQPHPQPQQTQQPPSRAPQVNATDESTNDGQLHECAICFCEVSRRVALTPCGHAGFCVPCATQLQTCPLCRAPVEGRLALAEGARKCRVCQHVIAPVILESHQEVCRLQRRELRKKLLAEHESVTASQTSLARAASSSQEFSPSDEQQQQTTQQDRLRCGCVKDPENFFAALPCGCCLCAQHAKTGNSCPSCATRIVSVLKMFE